jgi:predicted RNase H-like HicB family nuclease
MSKYIDLTIEKFEEGNEVYYLATSKDIQGLLAQGSTVEEAVEIARSLVVDLLELREMKDQTKKFTLQDIPEVFHYPLILSTTHDGAISRV